MLLQSGEPQRPKPRTQRKRLALNLAFVGGIGTNTSFPKSQEEIEHTFLHELTHWILHSQGKIDLRNDEEFVDVFSALLHQALTSMEYDDE